MNRHLRNGTRVLVETTDERSAYGFIRERTKDASGLWYYIEFDPPFEAMWIADNPEEYIITPQESK